MATDPRVQAILAVGAALDRDLVSGTPAEIASHFTSDAVLGESGAPDAIGRVAIEGFLTAGNAVRTVTHHQLHSDEIIFVSAHRAIEFGRFDETKVKHGDPTPVVERGRIVTDWRLEPDGEWRIARLVISDLP